MVIDLVAVVTCKMYWSHWRTNLQVDRNSPKEPCAGAFDTFAGDGGTCQRPKHLDTFSVRDLGLQVSHRTCRDGRPATSPNSVATHLSVPLYCTQMKSSGVICLKNMTFLFLFHNRDPSHAGSKRVLACEAEGIEAGGAYCFWGSCVALLKVEPP